MSHTFTEFKKHQKTRIIQYHRRVGAGLFHETIPLDVQIAAHTRPTPFAERRQLSYKPTSEGEAWGKGNERAWFHLKGVVPEHWDQAEITLWMDTGTEALVRDNNGTILQGLVGGGVFDYTFWKMVRPLLHLDKVLAPQKQFELWVEAACMTHPGSEQMDTPIKGGFTNAGFPNGVLHHCRLGRFNSSAWALYMDMDVLIDLMEAVPKDSARAAHVLRGLRLACDQLGKEPNNYQAAREILAPLLKTRANASALNVYAVGHGHLDTAWLWPLSTGREKVVRTFSNQLELIERYPGYIFGASAALHYQWLKDNEPTLFQRVQQAVQKGRWEIQGSMWVEADNNLPSGESLIRQMLFGTRFFEENFDQSPDILWLPDVFGYSAALPQIMTACGVRSLMTQKISWSQYHRFPHNSFRWRGIDGSEVLVHFPPEDNYCSGMTPRNMNKAEARFAEKDRLDSMLSLFGYGDGGGGPHPVHIERASRMADLEGSPKVRFAQSRELFDKLWNQIDELDTWHGELYLELHRKTLTTQAFIKRENRRLEERLGTLEMLFAGTANSYPAKQMRQLWEILLLNQFHDIIPGSGIQEVYQEAREHYALANNQCADLQSKWASENLCAQQNAFVLFNPSSYTYNGAVTIPDWARGQRLSDKNGKALLVQSDSVNDWISLSLPKHGFTTIHVQKEKTPAAPQEAASEDLVLENNYVRYEFNASGQLVSSRLQNETREFIKAGTFGNRLTLYSDDPTQWEAWDMDMHYFDEFIQEASCTSIAKQSGPIFDELVLTLTIGQSTITQRIRLQKDSERLDFICAVDWKENRKLLRVLFDTNIDAAEASYDIQFGYVARPARANTSREAAMFEACAHRYADLSDVDGGFALLNDCKYGYRAHNGQLSLTLLSAPLWPDPTADRGKQFFTYAILPHAKPHPQVNILEHATRLNQIPICFDHYSGDKSEPKLPVSVISDGVELSACKEAEEGQGIIIRLVERMGRRSEATLRFNQKCTIQETSALEKPYGNKTPISSVSEYQFDFKPFQIRTFRIYA